MSNAMGRAILAAAIVCSTATISLAQQSSSATETKTFEVIAVDGNQLIVSLPEGMRELTVPDDFRFTVNGQSLSVSQLTVGMKGTAVITTRTTEVPVTVTEVKNGTVVMRSGSNIWVRTDEGVKMFSQDEVDKRGVKIVRDGKPAQLSDFQNGDRLSATIITSKPPQILTEREVAATTAAVATSGVAPAAPAASPTLAASAPLPTPPSPGPQEAKTLPKTASSLPLVGFLALLSLVMGITLTFARRLS